MLFYRELISFQHLTFGACNVHVLMGHCMLPISAVKSKYLAKLSGNEPCLSLGLSDAPGSKRRERGRINKVASRERPSGDSRIRAKRENEKRTSSKMHCAESCRKDRLLLKPTSLLYIVETLKVQRARLIKWKWNAGHAHIWVRKILTISMILDLCDNSVLRRSFGTEFPK